MGRDNVKRPVLTSEQMTQSESALASIESDVDVGLDAINVILNTRVTRERRSLLLRIRALTAITLLGEKATPIAPSLLRIPKSTNSALNDLLGFALSAIGPYKEALPELIALLNADSYSVRDQAARAIGRYGQKGVEAIPALSEAIKTESFRTVRSGIVAALRGIGTNECLAPLRLASRDSYKSIQDEAKDAIKCILKS